MVSNMISKQFPMGMCNCVLPGYQMLTNFPAINVLNLNLHFRYLYILSCANHLTKPSYGQFKILL